MQLAKIITTISTLKYIALLSSSAADVVVDVDANVVAAAKAIVVAAGANIDVAAAAVALMQVCPH